MKTYYLILALFAGLFSCQNEDFSSDEIKQITPDEAHLKFATDGKYDLLGFGYDVTGEYLNATSTRYQVVDVDAFVKDPKNTGRYHENGTPETIPYIYSGANSEDFLNEIKTKNKIGTNATIPIGAASLDSNISGTADINNKYTYSTKYSFARVDVTRRVKMLSLNARTEDLIPYLNPAFINDLKRDSPEEIITKYGTHVLCDISIGARLQFEYRSVITEENNRSEKKLVVESGVNFNVGIIKFGGTANHEVEMNRERNKKNSSWTLQLKSYGNTHSGIGEMNFSNENPPQNQKIPFNLKEWELTTNATNAGLTNINWDRAFPIYEFVTDPVKKSQIKAAMEKHIGNTQFGMFEVAPLYRYFHEKRSDSFYTQDYRPEGFDGWKYQGIMGYVLTKPINGAAPFYEFWDDKGWDHLYSGWGGTPPAVHAGRWKLSPYIPAYIYFTQAQGTIALYEFWNDRLWDHHYDTNRNAEQLKYGWKYEKVAGYIYPAN